MFYLKSTCNLYIKNAVRKKTAAMLSDQTIVVWVLLLSCFLALTFSISHGINDYKSRNSNESLQLQLLSIALALLVLWNSNDIEIVRRLFSQLDYLEHYFLKLTILGLSTFLGSLKLLSQNVYSNNISEFNASHIMLRYQNTVKPWECGSGIIQNHFLGASTSYLFPKSSMDGINQCCYMHDIDYCCQIGRKAADYALYDCLHIHCVDDHCPFAIDVYTVLLDNLGTRAYTYAATDEFDCGTTDCTLANLPWPNIGIN